MVWVSNSKNFLKDWLKWCFFKSIFQIPGDFVESGCTILSPWLAHCFCTHTHASSYDVSYLLFTQMNPLITFTRAPWNTGSLNVVFCLWSSRSEITSKPANQLIPSLSACSHYTPVLARTWDRFSTRRSQSSLLETEPTHTI